MDEFDKDRFLRIASLYPPPTGIQFSYGTAGFRADASLLDSTSFRTGILAALRSIFVRCTIGLMITASHNPIHDNGIKIADKEGGMLAQDWEFFAENLANAPTAEALLKLVEDSIQGRSACDLHGRVLIARDTRPSGERLLNAAKQGIEGIPGVTITILGILTTPQLHWMVRAVNRGDEWKELDYYTQLSSGYRYLLENRSLEIKDYSMKGSNMVIVDGANGVGASKVSKLGTFLHGIFTFDLRNSGGKSDDVLNYMVGADFVQKEKKFPRNFGHAHESGKRCASLDGDADRIVFFYGELSVGETSQHFRLLDGDKILALFAIFIKKQLEDLCETSSDYGPIKFGVVQTAYANGASTLFLQKKLNVEVVFTATGVKHLHQKAIEYDIGIYFEANGHGTILFKDDFVKWLQTKILFKENHAYESSNAQWKAAQTLLGISRVMNQAIGDASSALLLVEVVLNYQGWSMKDWDAIYNDFPSRQIKVKVKDRRLIKTTNAERCVTHPPGLQTAIDLEVGKVNAGRAFVRPSGTEDIVRIYAEAATQHEADILASAVATHTYSFVENML